MNEGGEKKSIELETMSQEIGTRNYFKDTPVVYVRDSYEGFYGRGWGRRVLIQAQNTNQLSRDLLRVSAYYGDPVVEVPQDLLVESFRLAPGVKIPSSYTGEGVKLHIPAGDFRSQISLYEIQTHPTPVSYTHLTLPTILIV